MININYSKLTREAKEYYDWSKINTPKNLPRSVAVEGAGSEIRTPIMHYGTVLPVYLSVIRYLRKIKLEKGKVLRLVEIGSGTGRMLAFLKTLFPEIDIWGLDYSVGCINYANENYSSSGVKFLVSNANERAFPQDFFDVVISSHVIEHINKIDGRKFMQEAYNLLIPGGYLFIGTPERSSCQDLYCLNPNEDKHRRLVPPHEHEYYFGDLLALANKNFKSSNIKVDFLYNIVFRKIFTSSINKIKPNNFLGNIIYRFFRDNTPRTTFDMLTKISGDINLLLNRISYKDILFDNAISSSVGSLLKADNLFLVAKK